MRRLLLAVAILAVAISGILAIVWTSGAGDPDGPATAGDVDAERVIAPLTGLEVDDTDVGGRPVVALKVDNAPQARPQQRLGQADITFTELVEGGTTRFIALYHSTLPDDAGPVRSGRDVDAQVLPAFSPVFGISGAAEGTYAQLRGADLLVYEEGQADAFSRDGSRPSPHNLFASTRALADAADELPPARTPWPFDATVPGGGVEATGVDLVYSPFYRASWDWDPSRDAWLRDQEGAAHTETGGDQLTADTVVVARVTTFEGTGVDAGGNPVPEVDAIGEGEATILRDGRSYPARWRKTAAQSQFEWLDSAGEPLPLRPGRTWVELVPEAGTVTVDLPAGDG